MSSIFSSEGSASISSIRSRLDVLADFYGFAYTQKKGQRIFSRVQYLGPEPNLSCEVFIGRIPGNCFEDTLIPIFSQAGPIFEFRLLFKATGDMTRGYGFAKYYSLEDANNAIKLFDDYMIRPNWRLGVVHSENNCRLLANGLPLKSRELKEMFVSQIYKFAKQIKQIRFRDSSDATSAILEFRTHLEAAIAKKYLSNSAFQNPITKTTHALNIDFLHPHTSHWLMQQYDQVATYDQVSRRAAWLQSARDVHPPREVHQVNGSRRPILGKCVQPDPAYFPELASSRADARIQRPAVEQSSAFGENFPTSLNLMDYMVSTSNWPYCRETEGIQDIQELFAGMHVNRPF